MHLELLRCKTGLVPVFFFASYVRFIVIQDELIYYSNEVVAMIYFVISSLIITLVMTTMIVLKIK